MPQISVSRSGSGPLALYQALSKIRRAEVLVGIPQRTAGRPRQKINNAALLYIHTHGSPVRGIPARPVIEPAIQAEGNRQAIAVELEAAAKAWLDKNPVKATAFLRRAGIAGVNASKSWFVDPRNRWAPNAPSTIKRKGSDRPLIDTGAMRKSITFVVREET